jgi:hypothetical protein
MAEAKTRPTPVAVEAFLAGVEPAGKRAEASVLDNLFRKVTGERPRMWGPSIVGYGEYHTVYASGRKVDSLRVGFSPRKPKHSLYIACTCEGREGAELAPLLERLGKHSLGAGGCLYVNKLADIDLAVLEQIVALGWKTSLETYPD